MAAPRGGGRTSAGGRGRGHVPTAPSASTPRCAWAGLTRTIESTLNPGLLGAGKRDAPVRRTRRADVRTVLARLNLRGDDVFKPVGVLSGGERGRVALAKLLLSEAQSAPAGRADEPSGRVRAGARFSELLSGLSAARCCSSATIAAFSEAVATRFARVRRAKSLSAFEGGAGASRAAREHAGSRGARQARSGDFGAADAHGRAWPPG